MHGPVDGEISRSSRIPPSIAATVARRVRTSTSDRARVRSSYHGFVRPEYWLPPVVWMAAIMTVSSDIGSAEHTEHWVVPLLRLFAPWATAMQIEAMHGLVRKAGHLTEYALLAALWYRAFARGRSLAPRSAAALAFVISVIWAILDETRQSFVPSRTASARDVALDSTGAFLAMLV